MAIVELFVPSLVHALSEPAANLAALPNLERWLARARLERSPCESWEQGLCERFGVTRQADWPIAPLSLLADGGDPGQSYWLRADPAHLQATRGDLILAAAGDLGLAQAECDALTATLNEHFAAEGIQVIAPRPDRWYVRNEQPQDLHTTPPREATGRSIDPLLPRGEQALSWHRRLNEMQMLLHEHPVNAHREARGEPPVNSVWLWGGGCLPHCPRLSGERAWTDAPLARGLALCGGTPCSEPAASARDWLRDAGPGANHIIVLEPVVVDASASSALAELERRWFAPLLEAIRAGTLQRATLATQHGHELLRFTASRLDLWKFWRSLRPFPGAGARA